MKIKEKFQKELCLALQNNDLDNFLKQNQKKVKKIDQKLKKVGFSNALGDSDEQLKFKLISAILAHNFSKLLSHLSSPQPFPEGFNTETERDFYKEMQNAYSGVSGWQQFYEQHEGKFDYIIFLARNQNVVNFKLVKNRKQYYFFKDARLGQNERSSGLRKRLRLKSDKNVKQNTRSETDNSTAPIQRNPSSKILGKPRKQKKNKKSKALLEFDNELKGIVASGSGPAFQRNEERSGIINQPIRKIQRSSPTPSNSSDYWESRRKQIDESFQVKTKAQFERHQETLRALREERKRIDREAEEHLRKMREESALRIKFFLHCVRMKMRWEDQESEWDTWLTSTRQPIFRVKIQDFSCKSYEMIKREFEEDELRQELLQYQKYVQIAYYKMLDDFEDISTLSGSHEDRLFLKVLKKKMSDMAESLRRLLEAVEDFEDNEHSFERIKSEVSKVDPWNIPTANGLRRICKTAREEDFEFVEPPRRQRKGPVITEV